MGTSNKKNCLCVDNFDINYFSKDDADQLLKSIGRYYNVSTDWEGRNYLGLKI